MDENGRDICLGCGCEIDPEVCWCGSLYDGHFISSDHSFVPMGCICGFHESEDNSNIVEDKTKDKLRT